LEFKTYRKEMEKELENPGKKKKSFRPKPAHQAQPHARARARAIAAPDRWTPPVSASRPARSPLSLARCLVGPTCRRQLPSPARPLVSLLRGPILPGAEPLPRTPLSSLSAPWTLPVSSAPLRARRGPACAHSLTSPDFSATTPAHAPSSLLRAPPVPRTHPRLISRSSALATRRHRRPAPAFSTTQLAGERAKPPQAPPRGETPVPVPNFPYCALCSANFGSLVLGHGGPPCSRGVRPSPTSSSAWALAQGVPPPLLELARALSRPIAPSGSRDSSPELLRPARDPLPVVLPSLPSDSWPLSCH
jgi:hypothetical protein